MRTGRGIPKIVWAALALSYGGSAAVAEAHAVHIFAFPHEARICADSYFSGRSKVQGGQATMLSATGETLASARTDEQGRACFDRPETAQDLIFTVEASGGHRAEFRLPAAFWSGSAAISAPAGTEPELATAEPNAAAVCGDPSKALEPVMMKLAEMESAQNSRIGLKEIVGGLGWLVGLAGAALWGAARRKA